MFIMLIVLSLSDRGRDPGAYVKHFPYARSGMEGPGVQSDIVDRFVRAFGDLELTAEPNRRGMWWPYSTRWVLSQPSEARPFITVGVRPQNLIEVGVAEKALGSIPRIEAFFRSEGAMGTEWEIDTGSWEGRLALLGGMLGLLSLPLLILLDVQDWYMLLLYALIYVSMLAVASALILRNHRTERLLTGTAKKHLVMDLEDLAAVVLRASTRRGIHITRADAEIPKNRTLLRNNHEKIVAIFKGDGANLTILLTRRMIQGASQGYITLQISRYYRMDERLAKRLMRAIDAALGLALAEARSREFFESMA